MSSTRKSTQPSSRARLRQRTARLRNAIGSLELVVSGHIHSRTKVCGRPNCRCARDAEARHGPYYEWSRREGGRQRHSVVTPEQAKLLAEGIENHRRITSLLGEWERISAAEILDLDEA